jgi:hypothetical protein
MTGPADIPESVEESPAYEEGWTAYHQDLDRTDNPYDDAREPDAFRDWMRGWTDALEEAEAVDR